MKQRFLVFRHETTGETLTYPIIEAVVKLQDIHEGDLVLCPYTGFLLVKAVKVDKHTVCVTDSEGHEHTYWKVYGSITIARTSDGFPPEISDILQDPNMQLMMAAATDAN